jgi:hypothetical protein
MGGRGAYYARDPMARLYIHDFSPTLFGVPLRSKILAIVFDHGKYLFSIRCMKFRLALANASFGVLMVMASDKSS